jgi:nitroreductase / dihydropteridine reductase
MDFMNIVKARYATKKFDGKLIPEEKLEPLYEMIRLSASSFGLQPWKIKVITDQKTKDALLPLSWGQPQITTCSHLLVFCADTDISGLISKMETTMLKGGATKESIKGYIDMLHGFNQKMNVDERRIWTQKQCYIALGNAINGAKALGFDSCPMEGFDSAGYAKALKLPANLLPTVICPIGYAADTPKPKVRFEKKDVFF